MDEDSDQEDEASDDSEELMSDDVESDDMMTLDQFQEGAQCSNRICKKN